MILADSRFAWLWLALRVSLGWLLFEAGRQQLQGTTALGGPGDTWAVQAGAVGLTLAGIALILGACVGLAAFAGGLLSLLAPIGSQRMEPLLFIAVIWLVLTWKTAGWIGLDRWLLPLLGLPWQGGLLVGRVRPRAAPGIQDTPLERQWKTWLVTERPVDGGPVTIEDE